jgi:hypothetical protein
MSGIGLQAIKGLKLGGCVTALDLVDLTEIIDKRRDRRILRTGCLLVDRNRSLEHRFGFGIVALIAIEVRQIVQGRRNVAVNWSVFLLQALQLLLRQRPGFGVFSGTAEFVYPGAERRRGLILFVLTTVR